MDVDVVVVDVVVVDVVEMDVVEMDELALMRQSAPVRQGGGAAVEGP